jgi:DNA-directed RNA polymerase specialized sigma24 family protein
VGAVPIEPRDAGILEDLYDAYGASCYQLAHRIVGEEHLACTIVRDVFVAVWSGDSVFDPARGSVQIWLLHATHAKAISILRRGRQLSSSQVGSELLGQQPRLDTVLQYVLELAYFGGYTDSEIATRTDTTLGMVKSLKLQALRGMHARPSRPEPKQRLVSSRRR